MSDNPRYATLGDYLRVIRNQRWTVILTTLIFAAAAYTWSERQDPVYESEAALQYLDPPVSAAGVTVFQTAEQRAAIGARSADTVRTADVARRLMREKLDLGTMLGALSANSEVRSNLLVLRARDENPERAAAIANAFAGAVKRLEQVDARRRFERAALAIRANRAQFPNTSEGRSAQVRSIEQAVRLEQLSRLADPTRIITRAGPGGSPVTPRTTRNTIVAAFLGLALGVALAFGRSSLDRRLRDAADVSAIAEYPTLGSVRDRALGSSLRGNGGRGDRTLEDEDLEAFRIVRTNIDFLDVDQDLSTVLVTSSLAEEGKSTVAISIAAASALAGRRTLLLECDLRAPVLAARLKIAAGPGLVDFLGGAAAPAEVLQTIQVPHQGQNGSAAEQAPPLVAITAGASVGQPAELLSSSRFSQFIDQVVEAYDFVVIDAPPLLPVVDALELVQYAKAVVLCVRAHQTTRDELKAARSALERLPQRPTGVVITGVREGEGIAYGYYGDRARSA